MCTTVLLLHAMLLIINIIKVFAAFINAPCAYALLKVVQYYTKTYRSFFNIRPHSTVQTAKVRFGVLHENGY